MGNCHVLLASSESLSQFKAMSTAPAQPESSGKLSTRNIIEMFTFLSDLYLLMSGLSWVG